MHCILKCSTSPLFRHLCFFQASTTLTYSRFTLHFLICYSLDVFPLNENWNKMHIMSLNSCHWHKIWQKGICNSGYCKIVVLWVVMQCNLLGEHCLAFVSHTLEPEERKGNAMLMGKSGCYSCECIYHT